MSKTFGPSYEAERDGKRIGAQMAAVLRVLLGPKSLAYVSGWWTLGELEERTGYPQASLSAQLRHLRKREFGGYTVEKRVRGERSRGLYEYRVSRPVAVQLSLIA